MYIKGGGLIVKIIFKVKIIQATDWSLFSKYFEKIYIWG